MGQVRTVATYTSTLNQSAYGSWMERTQQWSYGFRPDDRIRGMAEV
ncbi:MAG: hypothetical protein ACLUVG_00395 [Phocaeicola vulgatus]